MIPMEDYEDQDIVNDILDRYLLRFLDNFEAIFERLPNNAEKALWSSGFLDGMYAMMDAIEIKKKE